MALESSSYRVEVLHFLNPHLIWVEVQGPQEKYVFEQIGLYGVVPMETTISLEDEQFVTKDSLEWAPAAMACMKRHLADREVWFKPVHIDNRSTIFNDNEHKFGNLTIRKSNNKFKKLSKLLTCSGFANYDPSLFHQYLSAGKIVTKLSSHITDEVINQLERFYTKRRAPRGKWENCVREQTSVFRASRKIELSLTEANLQKHDEVTAEIIKNKAHDFELCKGVDEESVGRASTVNQACHSTNEATLRPVDKQFEMVKAAKMSRRVKKEPAYKISKNFLDSNGLPKIGIQHDGPLKIHREVQTEGVRRERKRPKAEIDHLSTWENPAIKENLQVEEETAFHNVNAKYFKTKVKGGEVSKVVYGPPGFNISHVHPKLIAAQVNDELKRMSAEENNITPDIESDMEDEEPHKNKNQEDRDVADRITHSQTHPLKNNNRADLVNKKFVVCKKGKPRESLQVETSVSTASFMQRKVKQSKDNTKNKKTTPGTNGTQNEILNQGEKCVNTELYEFVNSPHVSLHFEIESAPAVSTKSRGENPYVICNSVNPFCNLDRTLSVFVDKLLTPVLLLHSKTGKSIQPVFYINDINFNKLIFQSLKLQGVLHPMIIQTISWFAILRGYSLFMVSPIGSGKTMGYLPAVCRLVADFRSDSTSGDLNSSGPLCVIICGSSKSVTYISRQAGEYLESSNRVAPCFAGFDDVMTTTSLLNGCDMLIITAPMLERLLLMKNSHLDLRRVRLVVLDDCERLSEAYMSQVKLALCRINEMLKTRAHKQLKVQYIVASRVWCDFMKPLALKAPDSVICIGAFQECVLYAKANLTVKYASSKAEKLKYLNNFMEELEPVKRTIIVCGSNEDVVFLKGYLSSNTYYLFVSNNNMTVKDLYNLSSLWSKYSDPSKAPVFLCCDSNLAYMNVTNAHYLIHYSMPRKYSAFCKRFSVLNDYYASIFKDGSGVAVKIHILLDETNAEQLPKIINFLGRCKQRLPEYINKACETILAHKDLTKAKNFQALCGSVLNFGECYDFYNCIYRHTAFKIYDQPKKWLPKSGIVKFKPMHHLFANMYAGRLIAHVNNGLVRKYPPTFANMSVKMGLYYCKQKNRIPLGVPKLGDIVAVSNANSYFTRCQIMRILNTYKNGKPNYVLIWLLDEGIFDQTRDVYLYHLPSQLKEIDTYVTTIRLANVKPKDNDIAFSDVAKCQFKDFVGNEENTYMRGNVVLALGNCVFVDTLEVCQDLPSVNETVVKLNVKRDLLERHADLNPNHMKQIKRLYDNLYVQDIVKPKTKWARLEQNCVSTVLFMNALDPNTIFIRLAECDGALKGLLQDIESFVENSELEILEVTAGDIVLAMNPNDLLYERARVDEIRAEVAKCFMVDLGQWRYCSKKDLLPIVEKFVTQLPFQAIECRLIGVEPLGDKWNAFCTNYLVDQFLENQNGTKKLCAKYFTEEHAKFTDGYKYGVVLVESHGENHTDIVINQAMIDVNLARGVEGEIKCFDEFVFTHDESNENFEEEIYYNEFKNVRIDLVEPNETYLKVDIYNDKSDKSADSVVVDQDGSNKSLDKVEVDHQEYSKTFDESDELGIRSFDKVRCDHDESNETFDEALVHDNESGKFADGVVDYREESNKTCDEVEVACNESDSSLDNGDVNHDESSKTFDASEETCNKLDRSLDKLQVNQDDSRKTFDASEVNCSKLDRSVDEVQVNQDESSKTFDGSEDTCNKLDRSLDRVQVNQDESSKTFDASEVNCNKLDRSLDEVKVNQDEFSTTFDESEDSCNKFDRSSDRVQVNQDESSKTFDASEVNCNKLDRSLDEVKVNQDESSKTFDESEVTCNKFDRSLDTVQVNQDESSKTLDVSEDTGNKSDTSLDKVQVNQDVSSKTLDALEVTSTKSDTSFDKVKGDHAKSNVTFDVSDITIHESDVNCDETDRSLDKLEDNHCETDEVVVNLDESNECDPPIDDCTIITGKSLGSGYFTGILKSISSKPAETSNEQSKDIVEKIVDNPDQQSSKDSSTPVITSKEFSSKDPDILSSETSQCAANTSDVSSKGAVSLLRKPTIRWYQTKTTLTVKIELVDVVDYKLTIKDKSLKFSTILDSKNYAFHFELYGVVDSDKATHCNKYRYILIKLNKIMPKNWPTLNKGGGVRNWIHYDFDAVTHEESPDMSDDDNTVNVNVVRKIINLEYDDGSDSDFKDDME